MTGIGYRQIQEQKQILSHKMIQSAEILQMDVQELETYIQREALENPLIDMDEMEKSIFGALCGDDGAEQQAREEFRRKLEWLNRMDEQNRVYYSEEYEEAEQRDPWNFAEEENDLQDYLMSQLMPLLKNKTDYDCMEFLVYSLDSRGYLTDNLKELEQKLGIDEKAMGRYLTLLQSVEPAGVGAGSLSECLQIQLRRMMDGGRFSQYDFKMLMQLTGSCMEALGKRHFTQAAAQMGIALEDLMKYYQTIQTLNPIPGNSFSSREKMRYIKPDVMVVKFENHFEVLVNDMNLPRVTVSSQYLNLMKKDEGGEVQDYLQNKYRQVQWIQHCIEERTSTLLNVSKAIVAYQQEFFESSEGKRVPMGLKDIAERLGIHESTVSRAVKNKFLQCTRGVYPMNYFFARKVVANDLDGTMTSELVKQKIREIIEKENKKKPLSDQKISDALNEMEIAVSRRTVAKYRGEMMIPDTTGRKGIL